MTVPYYGTNAPTLRAQARGNTVPFVSSFLELSTFTYPFILLEGVIKSNPNSEGKEVLFLKWQYLRI